MSLVTISAMALKAAIIGSILVESNLLGDDSGFALTVEALT